MKKMFLAMVLVLMMAVPVFADGWGSSENNYIYQSPNTNGMQNTGTINGGVKDSFNTNNIDNSMNNTATGGAGGAGGSASASIVPSVTVNQTGIYGPQATVNVPVLSPSASSGSSSSVGNVTGGSLVAINPNMYGPQETLQVTTGNILSPEANVTNTNNVNPTISPVITQGQQQGQLQGQNNGQTIAPTQTTTIITEKPFVAIPVVGTPELNFGNGHMMDAGKMLPKFKGVILLKDSDTIHTVIDVTANIPFKKLYKTILTLADDNKVQNPYMRFQIIRAEGQKSWTTGGAMSGGGTGIVGTSGVAGGGSLIPSIGGTKAHDLFTIVVVNVIPE